jgi:hypothetical protein
LGGTVAVAGVVATWLGRYWGAGGQHRAPRRPRAVEVPAHVLIPALARQVFAHCSGCRAEVPVTVHGGSRRCDYGHLTITGVA